MNDYLDFALSELVPLIPEGCIHYDEPMAAHTTFEIGGPADIFCEPTSIKQVFNTVRACELNQIPWFVLGCGSDLLVADEGIRGVVIHLGNKFSAISNEDTKIYAFAGATNAQVSEAAAAAGLTGYEFACGIPGSIGGAAIMNAGAYDGQFSDACIEVSCIKPGRWQAPVTIRREDAKWGYRQSLMAEEGLVVLSATFNLQPDDKQAIRARMDDLTRRRNEKQPLETPSAGSTFKRPEGYFAGKLIADAGCQGLCIGGAQVSEKHAGFVVNTGGASAADVRALIAEVQRRVLETSGVSLEPEVKFVGF